MANVKLAPRIITFPIHGGAPPLTAGTLALPVTMPTERRSVFGDGSHPTTRLCAATLDAVLRERGAAAVLDVGTGTGVLARIARARGATFVVGTDIDPVAREAAREHATLDETPIPLHVGDEAPDYWGPRFDLTVANILEAPLLALARPIMSSLINGGVVLISGFTRPQAPALRLAYEAVGGRFIRDAHLGDWALLMFERAAH